MAFHDEKGRITIDRQAAEKDVKRLREAVDVLKNSQAAIDTLSKEYYMQGATADAIVLKAMETKKNLTKMIDKLEETITFILRTVHHYEVLDEQIKQAIQAAANAGQAAANAAGIHSNNTSSVVTGNSGVSHGGGGGQIPDASDVKKAAEDVMEGFGSILGNLFGNKK